MLKKILWIVILGLMLISVTSKADGISDFQIERISIGDGALDYSKEIFPNKIDHLNITIRTKEFNQFLKFAYK